MLGVLAVGLAFAVWRAFLFSPAPGLGPYAAQAANPPLRTVPAPGVPPIGDDYSLVDGELIRRIPAPSAEARNGLLKQLRLAPQADIVAITIVWDAAPHFRSMQVGTGIVSRRLLHVLTNSLEIPLHRLEGIDVARKIGLPGDWVIRRDADLDACMTYVEEAVQRSGHPGFHIARRVQRVRGYDMRGTAHLPEQPVAILRPHRDVSPAPGQAGTLQQFGQALSAAIQRPVSVHAEPQGLKLTWQDNSHAYLDLGPAVSDAMIATLLKDVSGALGVTFAESEVETTCWRLEMGE